MPKKRKITLLLGAGFAIHMGGLSTNDINNLFSNDGTYQERYEGEMVSLYTFVNRHLSKFYYNFTFETFLALLEQILNFRLGIEFPDVSSTQDRDLTSVLFNLHERFKGSRLYSLDAQELWEIYRHYINLIIDAVAKYNVLDKCQNQAEAFQQYIDGLRRQYDRIKIYSTNYDTLCNQVLENHHIDNSLSTVNRDCFEREFIYDLNRFLNQPLTYFPLHGCTNIKRVTFNQIKYCLYEQKLPDIPSENSAGNPNGITFFSPIISGYNKLQHVNGKPFIFGFHAFANDLSESDDIFTLGYSYSDTHINSYLSTFSKNEIVSVTLDTVMPLSIDSRITQRIMSISDFFQTT